MKKNITPKALGSLGNKKGQVVAPSVQTLSFLKAFARTCHVERTLPKSLSFICVN